MSQERPSPPALSPELREVARGSVLNVFAMILGAVLGFLLTVVISRWLQPRNAGAFFELMAIFSILSYTLMLGADTGLTRWISRARAIGGLTEVRRILVIALGPVLLTGILAAGIMWVLAPEIAHTLLHGMATSDAEIDVRIVAPLVPLGAMSACILAALRAYGLMWPYLAIEGLGKPIARLGLVLAAIFLGLKLRGTVAGWSLPVALGLLAAWFILARLMRAESPSARHRSSSRRAKTAPAVVAAPAPARLPVRPETAPDATLPLPDLPFSLTYFAPASEGRKPTARQVRRGEDLGRHRISNAEAVSTRGLAGEFWRFAGPRGFAGTFQIVVVWLDILLVGALLSRYAAGVYGAVSKLAMVGNFALEGTRLAIGPQLSQLLARRELNRTAELYQSATRWLMMVAWPGYLIFAIFPTVALGIFGHSYASGASSLVVLSVAMLVSLGTGNVSVVLLMGGKSSWNVINTLGALTVNIVLNLTLMPHIGILGAAIAWAASIVLDNVAAVIEVWLLLGLRPFGPGYGLVVAATCGCFGLAGLAARHFLGESLVSMIVAATAGLAAFALIAYLQRVRLQLAGIASLLPGRPAPMARQADHEAAGAA
jgi:O-antigen/teichoic acid export membrane protein